MTFTNWGWLWIIKVGHGNIFFIRIVPFLLTAHYTDVTSLDMSPQQPGIIDTLQLFCYNINILYKDDKWVRKVEDLDCHLDIRWQAPTDGWVGVGDILLPQRRVLATREGTQGTGVNILIVTFPEKYLAKWKNHFHKTIPEGPWG